MQAKDIVLLASREAKGGTGMVTIAGQYLNLVLQDLKLNRELKINRVTQLIVVQANSYGPFALEADYLRTYDLWFPIQSLNAPVTGGITQFLTPVTMEQWDAEFKDPSVSNYPYEFATDLSTQAQTWSGVPQQSTLTSAGQLWIYPQSSGQITLTHRYMVNQPDITSPESSTVTPWFPFDDYLICATAARVMGVTGDDRREEYFNRAEAMLRPYLIEGDGDEQGTVRSVKLDRRHFRPTRGLRPVKVYPY